MVDYDSPWKDALDGYFESFIALFFPAMYEEIDWSRGYETLDKELQQITPDAEDGRRYVDKLVQVWRQSGEPEWVLIHVEVQGQEETAFAQRMFVYNCRLVERYNKSVVSIAMLADENPHWQPALFRRELWGCSTEFRFPVIKLLAQASRADELEASDNPFAWFILAHVKALETKKDNELRYRWKLRLIRNLFERGLSAEEIRRLFRLIDWVITLPEPLVQRFKEDLSAIEEQEKMPYVTSIERLGIQKGIEQGIEKGIEQGIEKGFEQGRAQALKQNLQVMLNARFGESAQPLIGDINQLTNADLLDVIFRQAVAGATVEELRNLCR